MLSTSLLFGNQRTNQSAPFADPYVDLASMVMPRSAKDILDLCEKLWMRNGMYRMAAGRIVRYFITRVAFGNTPETTATRFRTFLENRLRVTASTFETCSCTRTLPILSPGHPYPDLPPSF